MPIDLEQLFTSVSPPRDTTEKKLGPAFDPPPAPKASKFTSKENVASYNNIDGSPIASLSRKPNARPKLKMRRTMSMIDKPEDTCIKPPTQKLLSIIDSPANHSPGECQTLPCFTVKDDPLRRINRSILLDVLDNKYRNHYDEHIVIDCRFDYEYEGGHVQGAININTVDALEEKFFTSPRASRTLVIFHCEYSAVRAPRM